MKLEYLASGSPDCPLLRIFDFTSAEARELAKDIAELASGTIEQIEVHRLTFVEPIGDCKLTLLRQSWDQSVVIKDNQNQFECAFMSHTWDNVAGQVQSLAETESGFQWLAASPGEAALLLSVTGEW